MLFFIVLNKGSLMPILLTTFNATGSMRDSGILLSGKASRMMVPSGSVIGTSRSAGENIDIYIGGVLCGSGEIVVIENNLGVRITDFREDL
jgi:hypothetical protein